MRVKRKFSVWEKWWNRLIGKQKNLVHNQEQQNPNKVESFEVKVDREKMVLKKERPDIKENIAIKKIPKEWDDAYEIADIYVRNMYMSRQAIYEQLSSKQGEHYAVETVEYAMNRLQVNWGEIAVQKAKAISDAFHSSKRSIYEDLSSAEIDKFTKEEALYAIEHAPIDYKENAFHLAKFYCVNKEMSEQEIIDQLDYVHFTKEEIDHAIKQLKKQGCFV